MNIQSNFYVEYGLIDTTASADSIPSTSSNKSFADISKLTTGTSYSSNIATLEHNQFILNGNMSEYTENDIVFYSSDMSGEDGTFETNPKIVVDFNLQHSVVGLTFTFVEDYPLEAIVKFTTSKGTVLWNAAITFTGLTSKIFLPIANFMRMEIEFTKTLPYRYVKMNKLMFGIVRTYDETKITEASLVEELDQVSNQLSINQLTFSIIDIDDELNFGNSAGLHTYIQTGQEIYPFEEINGATKSLGRYFVDKFSEESNLAKFTCVDWVGRLDKKQFYKGKLYNGETVSEIVSDIMTVAGITDYVIGEDIASLPMYGTIKPGTCRDALREVAFSCGALVDTTRSHYINIFTPTREIKNVVGRDRKISTKVARKEYVSTVTVSFNDYTLNTDTNEILTGEYSAGDNLIIFDSPYINITTTSGTIKESGIYYCILNLSADAEVTLSGVNYTENNISVSSTVDLLESGESENEVSYSCTLANASQAKVIADRLLNWRQLRLQIEIQYLAQNEQVKNWNIVKNPIAKYNDYVAGFESITTDLVNGFVSTATLLGYYSNSSKIYFAGTDIYAPDLFII